MSEQRPIEDEIDELKSVQHEIQREAAHPELVRPLAERSVELAEDIYQREQTDRRAIEGNDELA